jgi:hypothetical protein
MVDLCFSTPVCFRLLLAAHTTARSAGACRNILPPVRTLAASKAVALLALRTKRHISLTLCRRHTLPLAAYLAFLRSYFRSAPPAAATLLL